MFMHPALNTLSQMGIFTTDGKDSEAKCLRDFRKETGVDFSKSEDVSEEQLQRTFQLPEGEPLLDLDILIDGAPVERRDGPGANFDETCVNLKDINSYGACMVDSCPRILMNPACDPRCRYAVIPPDLQHAEYSVRVRNPTSVPVSIELDIDGSKMVGGFVISANSAKVFDSKHNGRYHNSYRCARVALSTLTTAIIHLVACLSLPRTAGSSFSRACSSGLTDVTSALQTTSQIRPRISTRACKRAAMRSLT
jgi:hypothetical protein